MIYFIPLDIPLHWAWVKERVQCIFCEDTCGIVALDSSGEIQAAFIFDSFTNTTCMVHIAIKNPMVLRRGMLREAAWYLFETRARERVFSMVASNNEKSLKFSKNVGWEELYRIKDGYDVGVDYILQVMTKDACPWYGVVEEVA